MKVFIPIKVIALGLIMFSHSVFADITTGKVSILRLPTNTDVNTIYFTLSPMPSKVTQIFYIRHGSGDSSGCTLGGNERTTERAYSLLLTAKTTQKAVTVNYCVDNNGYGLVNKSIELN